ncbi:Bacterial Transmembrane Pair family protein [Roseovarius albus]|uniref:Bacterial Transmembrane Pair family protein n=1 Tax=Roseovarius albus TaxID=1247867 RepID=A0A1X6YLS9_9RHOB|nr:PACE efflux transporter [Roseovarius albus]SLN24262.1 Bacterial Transmembrane Pair family protein [Roseovarius albus]
MSETVALRTGKDRMVYAVSFEVILMMLLIPAGAMFFNKGFAEIGLLGVILSLKAMLMHLIYNWVFDRIDARSGRTASERSHLGRIVHAMGFEVTLMLTSLPILMWFLQVTVLQALATDAVVTTFVVGYTYVFTLVFDRLFPVIPKTGVCEA